MHVTAVTTGEELPGPVDVAQFLRAADGTPVVGRPPDRPVHDLDPDGEPRRGRGGTPRFVRGVQAGGPGRPGNPVVGALGEEPGDVVADGGTWPAAGEFPHVQDDGDELEEAQADRGQRRVAMQ